MCTPFFSCAKFLKKDEAYPVCKVSLPDSVVNIRFNDFSNKFDVWNNGKYAFAYGKNSVSHEQLLSLLKSFNAINPDINFSSVFAVVTYLNKPLASNDSLNEKDVVGLLVYSENKKNEMFLQILRKENGKFVVLNDLSSTADMQTSNDISLVATIFGGKDLFVTAFEQSTFNKLYARKATNTLDNRLIPFLNKLNQAR